MAKFLTIGYGDQAGYDATDASVKADAHKHDDWLTEQGALMGMVGAPMQVRNHGATGTQTEAGAFMSSPLPIAGFAIIEAKDVDEAMDLVSRTPCAVANGVVEVWPLLSGPV
jgi:hypothetical protein